MRRHLLWIVTGFLGGVALTLWCGRQLALNAQQSERPGNSLDHPIDVLDLGCGTGRNLVHAAKAFPQARFHGLDISAEMLETASVAIGRRDLFRPSLAFNVVIDRAAPFDGALAIQRLRIGTVSPLTTADEMLYAPTGSLYRTPSTVIPSL